MRRMASEQKMTLLALSAACLAVFLTALDQTVVVTALPQIILDLQVPVNQLDRAAWIISGYLLGYITVLPLMGRASDIYGRRRIFLICLGIFAFASLFCGLAPILGNTLDISLLQNFGINTSSPGLVWLVVARFVQATGGGAIIPVTMAIAGDLYGKEQRALTLGLIGMVTEAGGVLGPLYGSLIVQSLGWQAIFYLNLPLVALLLIPILLFIPSMNRNTGADRSQERLDILGAILLGASLICLSLGLSQEAAQITPLTTNLGTAPIQNNFGLIAAAILLVGAFIALEAYKGRRDLWPLVDLSLFKQPMFSATSIVSLLVGAALIIAMADIPIFFATVLNRPAIDSGLALLRLTAMIPVGALIGGWLCGRITYRWTALLGLILTALGFWLMHLWPLDVGWTQITVSTLIGGLGFGLVIAPLSTTAINAADDRQIGMASSVVFVLRMIGMILGLAALTSWGLGRFRTLAAGFKPPLHVVALSAKYNELYSQYLVIAAHEVYATIFLAAGILCVIALVPAIFLEERKPPSAFARSTDNKIHTSSLHGEITMESEAHTSHGQ